MEFVDGVSLRQLLDAGKLSPQEALAIVPQICDALQYAHNAGVVHRDIKPENVLLDRNGQVKIADFGLAKLMGREPNDFALTGTGQVMGTPHYMAPEQLEHPQDVDHRADIYSLGVVFYQMLTGELPLGRFAPPSAKVQIDVRLDEVVLRALEKEPERRYQQVSEVKTDVETIASTAGPVPSAVDQRLGERTSELVEILQDRLKEYGYTKLEAGETGEIPFVAVLSTTRRRMVRYLCVVAAIPSSVADCEGLTRFSEQIRRALAARYARFPYWKELGTYTVLLCGKAQYEEFRHAITGLKDRTGFHVNAMLGTCLVDVDDGRSTGEPTWGLYYSGKHYGAIRAAISEWCERPGEEARSEKEPGRRCQQTSQVKAEAEAIVATAGPVHSAVDRPPPTGTSVAFAWIALGLFVAGLLGGAVICAWKPDAGITFGLLCEFLALVFGILGRRHTAGKVALVGVVVLLVWCLTTIPILLLKRGEVREAAVREAVQRAATEHAALERKLMENDAVQREGLREEPSPPPHDALETAPPPASEPHDGPPPSNRAALPTGQVIERMIPMTAEGLGNQALDLSTGKRWERPAGLGALARPRVPALDRGSARRFARRHGRHKSVLDDRRRKAGDYRPAAMGASKPG